MSASSPPLRPEIAASVDRIAVARGVESAALRAFARVETGSAPFWRTGRCKRLFELHVFYARIHPDRRDEAVRLGIAWPVFRRENYDNQRGEVAVMAMLARAVAFDPAAAYASTSYGLGQVMGFNAALCGYADGRAMGAAFDASLDAQVEAMVRFMASTGVLAAVGNRDWRRAARIYNGPREADSDYHGRLERAYDEETDGAGVGRLALAATCPVTAAGVAVEGASGVDAVANVAPAVTDSLASLPSMPPAPAISDPLTSMSGLCERAEFWMWRLRGILEDLGPLLARIWAWLLAHPSVLVNVSIILVVLVTVEVFVVRRRLREHRARLADTNTVIAVGVAA